MKPRAFFVLGVALATGPLFDYGLESHAQTLFAGFDDLPEGYSSKVISDGGISFSNLQRPRPDEIPPVNLAIDFMTGLPGQHESAMMLNFGGYGPGPGGGFSQFGSMDISFDGVGSSVIVNIVASSWDFPENVLTLEATLNMIPVAGHTVSLGEGGALPANRSLLISGVQFDHLRLFAGPASDASVYFVVDDVSINLVPEPNIWLLLLVAGILATPLFCIHRLGQLFRNGRLS